MSLIAEIEASPKAKKSERSSLIRITPDRRRYRRVELKLLGRYMRENREEHSCRLLDISVGGCALQSALTVNAGEHVVAYFDELGRIEGKVVRRFEGGFSMTLQATLRKREKLAAQLTWLINRNVLGLSDERRHDRTIPDKQEMTLHLPNNARVVCKVHDISVGGASISCDARLELGTEVVLGRLRGRVVRRHENGIGIEFTDIQNPSALKTHFS